MIQLLAPILLCPSLGVATGDPPPAAVAVGEIHFESPRWTLGSQASLTFSVAPGRGFPGKVAAFLYFSKEPDAFNTSPYVPMFVGIFDGPGSITVTVPPWPERGPITANSTEKFVQGALFSVQTGLLDDVTNEEYLDIIYTAAPAVIAFDFETEDDASTPLVNGQDLSTPDEFGVVATISSLQPAVGPQHQGPAIFDSDPAGPNMSSSDPDLLVDLGNVCILQENAGQTVPGIFDFPDDSDNGGSIVFEFTSFDEIEKVEPVSIDLIDIAAGPGTGVKLFMTDILGRTRIYTVPQGWTGDIQANGPPGYGTLDLTTIAPQPGFSGAATVVGAANFLPDEVVRIEVLLGTGGAIDNLILHREAESGLRNGGANLPGGLPGRRAR